MPNALVVVVVVVMVVTGEVGTGRAISGSGANIEEQLRWLLLLVVWPALAPRSGGGGSMDARSKVIVGELDVRVELR